MCSALHSWGGEEGPWCSGSVRAFNKRKNLVRSESARGSSGSSIMSFGMDSGKRLSWKHGSIKILLSPSLPVLKHGLRSLAY